MSFFRHDFDELASQLQTGLERIAVNFLRSHGARVRRDSVDFHGVERIELELVHGGHTLTVHQVGLPRGPGVEQGIAVTEQEFEALFDGWPTTSAALETLAAWLESLPAGEAAPDINDAVKAGENPFARAPEAPRQERSQADSANPFALKRGGSDASNPFADSSAERRRQEMLRRLRGE